MKRLASLFAAPFLRMKVFYEESVCSRSAGSITNTAERTMRSRILLPGQAQHRFCGKSIARR